MRNWKPISIKQMRGICKFNTYDETLYNNLRCNDKENYCYGYHCEPSCCTRWRKFGRSDLEVRKKGESCRWAEDKEDGIWETQCKQTHCFEVDGPIENEHKYCPYCGKLLVVNESILQ